MKNADNISEFTVYRLSIYKRCLEELERDEIKTISSKDMAVRFGLNSAQLRKDLAYFGEFGIRGMGYPVTTLKEQILHILGLEATAEGPKIWRAVVVGAGRLGAALLKSHEFQHAGFELVAAFDIAPDTAEYALCQENAPTPTQPPLYPITQLETVLAAQQVDLAILATPAAEAQTLTNRLVTAGIEAILNFAPVQLLTPAQVKVRTVDLVAELQCLTYHLSREVLAAGTQVEK